MRLLAVFVVPIFFGCRSETKAFEDESQQGQLTSDADGDGFLVDEDCDDDESMINPAATEVCDGLDNNCDGQIDEGTGAVFYADEDEDGFGTSSLTKLACEAPEGYVPNANDCDDASSEIH